MDDTCLFVSNGRRIPSPRIHSQPQIDSHPGIIGLLLFRPNPKEWNRFTNYYYYYYYYSNSTA